jgi:hypothetical protein
MARDAIKYQAFNMDSAENKRRLAIELGSLRGLWHVNLKPCRLTCSVAQRGYIHGTIFPMLAAWMKEEGWENCTEEYAKELLKHKHLRISLPDPETGEEIYVTQSTESLTRAEYNKFIDDCRAWMLKWCNVFVPEPDPRWREVAAEQEYAEEKRKERDNASEVT